MKRITLAAVLAAALSVALTAALSGAALSQSDFGDMMDPSDDSISAALPPLPPPSTCRFCDVPCSAEDLALEACGSGTCSHERICTGDEREAMIDAALEGGCFSGNDSLACVHLTYGLGFSGSLQGLKPEDAK